jgi:prepilin-type N-terminal cleavage/methylation domain-containing protein
MNRRTTARKAFTLVELIAVIVVLAILAAVAVPRYFDYTDRARTATVQGILGNVRTGLANFYANTSFNGTPNYPTLAQLTTVGSVMQDAMPRNPYNNGATVSAADATAFANRTIDSTAGVGWRYFVDNTAGSQAAGFYCNSNVTTTASNGSGGFLTANNL